jgi:hypothetical protein
VQKSLRINMLGKPRRKWENNIKMDFKESGCEDGRWMVQDECLLADIDISGVELSGSATRNYVHSFS